jgi:NADPH:quinone reductase-like Zn-dependent oxidoreductase
VTYFSAFFKPASLLSSNQEASSNARRHYDEDFAGEIVESNDDVADAAVLGEARAEKTGDVQGERRRRLKPGDKVFGTADIALGAFAEYVSVPAGNVALKPENVSWEAAASLPTSGQTALQALRIGGELRAGDRVLVNGGSGGVGSFAVQLAKASDAHVTAVCSTRNVEMVKSLGADVVIDYTQQSVDAFSAAAGEVKYDKIIDAVGRYHWRHLLSSDGGVVVAVALPDPESECIPCQLCFVACFSSHCCCCLSSKKSALLLQIVSTADLEKLAAMAGEGTIQPALGLRLVGIDAIPDALASHFETNSFGRGHRVGKTTVSFTHDARPPEVEEMVGRPSTGA